MLQYKITLTNFYTLAVTITILSNLNNNKILVKSYQLNSHHHPHKTDDLSRATPSTSSSTSLSASSRLPSTSTVFHENKLNHHLNLDNTNYNAQEQQLQHKHNKFQQQQQHSQNSYETSNRRHNLGFNKKYLHHIPSTSISSQQFISSSEKSGNQQKFENKEYYNNFKHNEYPREIYNPSLKSTSLKSISSSSIASNDKSHHHHKILDEATHPFSYSLPTHIAISNQKHSTSTNNNFHHNHQNQNVNLHQQRNPQSSHYSHEHQLNSAAINLRTKSYSTPTISTTTTTTTKVPIKLHRELNQHKISDQHHHHSHHSQSHPQQHHRHYVNPSVNIETIKDLNERQEKLHSIILSSKSHNKTMTPSATNVKGAPLPLTFNRKNSLQQQQQQHHEKKQHQHKHSTTTMDINESKSKYHHTTDKKETTPKHSIESSIRRHHHYDQHNINQYHQDIVNKNEDNINKAHKTNNDHSDHDSYDNHDSKTNNSDNNDRDDDDDGDDEEDDEEDYYYENEDHKNDNHMDYDNDNDDNNLELEVKGDDGGNNGKDQQKNSYNPNKRITLNHDYHEQNRYHNKNRDSDNEDNNDDEDDDIDEQYEDDNDDLDLIKKHLINREVLDNFERDIDLYDYIDDEPHNVDDITNTERSSNLTQEKWKELGTPQAVARTRNRYYSQVQRVNKHIMRVGYEAECRVPKPKIIQISEPSKRYVPHCTVLHRCSDDTGCCQSDFRTCVMNKSETVDLYFYVVPLGMKEPIIEVLSFENHTECHCVERERNRPQINRNDTMNSIQNEQQITTTTTTNSTDSLNSCQCAKHFTVFEENNRYDDSDYHDTDNYDTNKLKKKCRCDCVSNDAVCQSFKQGLEGFAVEDRRCISENRCLLPTCEFGEYTNGRCPKTKQKRYITTWHFD